jgi:hypothetical protein
LLLYLVAPIVFAPEKGKISKIFGVVYRGIYAEIHTRNTRMQQAFPYIFQTLFQHEVFS